MNEPRIGVIGAGNWGTTLADLLATKGFVVDLWVYEPELAEIIQKERENTYYLPGFKLSENIHATHDLELVVKDHDLLVMVVPSHVYREVVLQILPYIKKSGTTIVTATKGIENDTLLTMCGIWEELIPEECKIEVAPLAGPSFAKEVIRKVPTAVTIAASDLEKAKMLQRIFSTGYFRVYTSVDKIGVEIGGALKNVIALAAGACDGLGFGHNTRAALITRGLAEITRLGVKMGAHPMTFAGLAGLGDLVLTCTGGLSRNRTVGYQLGKGKSLQEILREMKTVAEGINTARSVHYLAQKIGVEMPICEQVYLVLYENKDPVAAVSELMGRDLKHEMEDYMSRDS